MRKVLLTTLTALALMLPIHVGTAQAEQNSTTLSATQALAYPSGWADDANTTTTYETSFYKIVTRLQLFRQSASTNAYDTVTAVRGACSIRKLGPTTGVKVNDCALGIDGGATLTADGEFLDGGACCANGFSPFRYATNPPSDCCTGFRARGTYSYRITTLSTLNILSNSTAHVFNLSARRN
jgi:hypothetical protein